MWKNDHACGWGVKTFSTGDCHIGEYRDDQRNGFGTYSWTNGDRVEGMWENGRIHGEASFHFADGHVFKGLWRDGSKHGKGIFSSPTESWEQLWENGVLVEQKSTRFYPPRLMGTKKEDLRFEDRSALMDEVMSFRLYKRTNAFGYRLSGFVLG